VHRKCSARDLFFSLSLLSLLFCFGGMSAGTLGRRLMKGGSRWRAAHGRLLLHLPRRATGEGAPSGTIWEEAVFGSFFFLSLHHAINPD
jgi:hypothetical protein